MFDQILIDYCNPKTFLVGGNWKKGKSIHIWSTDVSFFPNIFAEIFFGDLSDIFFFLPIIWTNVGCKKCNLSIQYYPQLNSKKGAIWLKMGSRSVQFCVSMSELHTVCVCAKAGPSVTSIESSTNHNP